MPKMVLELHAQRRGDRAAGPAVPHAAGGAARDGRPDRCQGRLRHRRLRRLHRPPRRQAGGKLPGAGDAGARPERPHRRGAGLATTARCTRSRRRSSSTACRSAASASPGMIMSASALLEENPAPSEEEIRLGIAGNLCRCTGYTKMVAAISEAAGRWQGGLSDGDSDEDLPRRPRHRAAHPAPGRAGEGRRANPVRRPIFSSGDARRPGCSGARTRTPGSSASTPARRRRSRACARS